MGKKPRVLVVEDEVLISMSVRLCLEEHGCTVAGVAASAKHALSLAKRERPDVVLMDITLSGGLDGVEAAKQIMSELDIPVIYMTGHTDEVTMGRAMQSNPAGFLRKPVEDEELMSAIKKAIEP